MDDGKPTLTFATGNMKKLEEVRLYLEGAGAAANAAAGQKKGAHQFLSKCLQ